MTLIKTSSAPDTGNASILLVDDEEFFLDLVREILVELGYEVMAMRSSLAALHLFSTAPSEFDVVITDERMPELSGSDLSAQILDIRPDIPVILHTDYPDATAVKRARDMGVKAIVGKSSNMKQLISHVRHLLNPESCFC